MKKEINSAVVEHCSYSNDKDCSYSDEEDHGKIIRRMTKHTEWSVIASKVKTHYGDKTTSVLLIHDIVRIHSSHERFKDLQQDVKIATHAEALMSRNDDDEGYEFAQQAKDSSDSNTLQNVQATSSFFCFVL